MNDIKFSRNEADRLVVRLKAYFREELDHDIGSFEAEFLIDYLSKEIGPTIYTQGVKDACKLYLEKTEEPGYFMQALEKTTA